MKLPFSIHFATIIFYFSNIDPRNICHDQNEVWHLLWFGTSLFLILHNEFHAVLFEKLVNIQKFTQTIYITQIQNKRLTKAWLNHKGPYHQAFLIHQLFTKRKPDFFIFLNFLEHSIYFTGSDIFHIEHYYLFCLYNVITSFPSISTIYEPMIMLTIH